jgi:Transposase DDE domain
MGNSIDWKSYNRNLIGRGQISFWFAEDTIGDWIAAPTRKRGGQIFYSDTAIDVVSVLRFRFSLTLREAQGFAESLMEMRGIALPIPNYTTLSRRLRTLPAKLEAQLSSKEALHVVVDSTGLKVYGEGEWKVRQHGYSKRRTWLKLHLAVDSGSNQILSAALSTNDFKDNQLLSDLVDKIPGKIDQVSADGAYDSKDCYAKAKERGFFPAFPPRKRAKLKTHGNSLGLKDLRDENIRGVRKLGRKAWKKKVSYHQRSLSETAMYRFKTILGERVSSREFDRQAAEVFLKCRILNKMLTPKFA